jgi:hypothetical protein
MSTPPADTQSHNKPAPEDLAGTTVCKEEDNATSRVRGRGRKIVRGAPPAPPQAPPTADDLAGTPVSAEGEEDLTVRPRKPKQRQ